MNWRYADEDRIGDHIRYRSDLRKGALSRVEDRQEAADDLRGDRRKLEAPSAVN
jgi:hypothetical protein